MNRRPDIPPQALQEQHKASDPSVSAWASANAGSGKTHVLTERVIKLLLQGEDPAKILCITFTKAAAATMASRVFDTLAAWTAFDNPTLDDAIARIGLRPNPALRLRARRLFALALETPGGLKVQTIHAFCTRLLHQFPFEAGVGISFDVLDDTTQHELLARLSLEVMLEAAADPDSALGQALAHAITAAADQTFRDLVHEAVEQRDTITAWIARAGSVDAAMIELSQTLGLAPDESAQELEDRTITQAGIAPSEWMDIVAVLLTGNKSDREQAERLRLASTLSTRERLLKYLSVFCTEKLQPRQSIVTRAINSAHPELAARLQAEQTRICELLERKRAADCRDRTRCLLVIAQEVIQRYASEKARRGSLDYEDLIDRTLALFRRTSAAWVLYKLDLGINHLLLDEAQDTSPKQWEIIRTLVSEFTAGAGARSIKRTMFAVGDDKQSIFSFQGAAPEKFGSMRAEFRRAFEAAELEWRDVKLQTSFRSSAMVLQAVDAVFSREAAYRGLSSDRTPTVHQALPDALPGNVDIWPLVKADAKRDIEGWDAPFDETSESSPQVRLAQKIARHVQLWCGKGTSPRDILVLVRQRGPLFEAIIRALKGLNLPVAGADRLTLIEHIAVMDLIALADALLLPEDDLALACALKSPLFGLTEEQLFRIAWNRGKSSLRTALFAKAGEFAEVADRLKTLTDEALRETPFSFFARLLGPGHGRSRILARLGPEANDALDEFLNLALVYEQRETPSLQGFLAWLRAAAAEVKRDMDVARDEVRVMTVHGAKGLEAPIVVLADTTTRPEGQYPPRLLELPVGSGTGLVWAKAKDTDPPAVAVARNTALDLQRDEYRRLLYVGMTRAKQRLIICGAAGRVKNDGTPSIPKDCWYCLIEEALVKSGDAVEIPSEDAEGVIWRYKKPDGVSIATETSVGMVSADRQPDWLTRPVTPEPVRAVAVTPSQADGAYTRTRGSAERRMALARGRILHRLIQSLPDLPPELRSTAAQDYLRRNADELAEGDRAAIAAEVLGLLEDARFAALFAAGSRAEVPIAGLLPRNGLPPLTVSGQLDRLVVGTDSVLIADYKTDREAPNMAEAVPRSYRRQLALYRALLQRIYPGREVRAALVWTEIPMLMEMPASVLDAELATLTSA